MKSKSVLILIWAATIFTKFIYTFLWYGTEPKVGIDTSHSIQVGIIYGVLGLISVIIGVILARGKKSSSQFLKETMEKHTQMVPQGNITPERKASMLKLNRTTMSLGFVEAPALFGLVHYYLNFNSFIYFALLALSLLGWLLVRPKTDKITEDFKN